MVEERTFVLWNHEIYVESPARKSFFISWLGNLYKAEFYLDVDPENPPLYGCVTKVCVNEYCWDPSEHGDPCDVMRFDITNALKNNEVNQVVFYHSPGWAGIKSGKALGTITIRADKILAGGVPPEIPWYWWALAIVGGVAGIVIIGGVIIYRERMRMLELLLLGR